MSDVRRLSGQTVVNVRLVVRQQLYQLLTSHQYSQPDQQPNSPNTSTSPLQLRPVFLSTCLSIDRHRHRHPPVDRQPYPTVYPTNLPTTNQLPTDRPSPSNRTPTVPYLYRQPAPAPTTAPTDLPAPTLPTNQLNTTYRLPTLQSDARPYRPSQPTHRTDRHRRTVRTVCHRHRPSPVPYRTDADRHRRPTDARSTDTIHRHLSDRTVTDNRHRHCLSA